MITERFAEFVVEWPQSDIPEGVVAAGADAFIDVLGAALAGGAEPASRIALRVTRTEDAGEAAVWGQRLRTSAEDAAFLNGIQGHALDFDDSALNMRGHASTVMLPAALAAGQAVGASGRAVMEAYGVGLEIALRVSKALGEQHYLGGWHATGTAGLFGAVSAAGRLFRLNRKQQQMAFGIAASQLAAMARNLGTMTKPFHAGNAARCGVFSARLAAEGFTADANIFEGHQNVLTVYGAPDSVVGKAALDSLGATWELETPGLYVKRWPCCYAIHRPLAVLQRILTENGLSPGDVESIEIGFLPQADAPLKYRSANTGLEGKFSVECVLALFLLDGKIGLSSFTDENVTRTSVRELASRVKRFTIESEGVFSGLAGHTDIIVHTKRGRFTLREDRTPGSPDWPLTSQERNDKFLDCASVVMTADRAKSLLAAARNLRHESDVGRLAWC